MSGEFLRGVLAQNAKVSRLRAYNIATPSPIPAAGSTKVLAKIETGTTFLVTQITANVFSGVDGQAIGEYNSRFGIRRVNSSKTYYQQIPGMSLMGKLINQTFSLPSYPYFQGDEYVEMSYTDVGIGGVTTLAVLTLIGIEYRMT